METRRKFKYAISYPKKRGGRIIMGTFKQQIIAEVDSKRLKKKKKKKMRYI